MQYEFLNHPELAEEYRTAMLNGETEASFHSRVIIDNIFNLSWQEQVTFWPEILDYNYRQGFVPGNELTKWW